MSFFLFKQNDSIGIVYDIINLIRLAIIMIKGRFILNHSYFYADKISNKKH